MKEIIITGNHKILRIWFTVLGICGVLILGGHTYNFFNGEMMERWYINLALGLLLTIGAGGYALGLINLRLPEIYLNDEGIRSSKTAWESSFKWEKLKHIELYKNKIEIQYVEPGLKNEIPIPYLIRLNSQNLQILNIGLTEFSKKIM
tara:strand:- start:7212 stop:7655 length:444 start_codon:yes stop_codon:yes gene_type:complete